MITTKAFIKEQKKMRKLGDNKKLILLQKAAFSNYEKDRDNTHNEKVKTLMWRNPKS
jgi:hypothetical protein